ncbi:YwlC protein [Coprinopsis marcescibilis]|uniref:Threonylcarbamoyl-AMP synthase n=1 Tax=Coprinopsis marcescibilis TaxID=230819 RepID=A0A5C3L9W3_COPMA|nr:YwlC protein [Coprinopsis marcescibilis]
MASQFAAGYRGVLRELRKSLDPSRKVNPVIKSHYRSVIEGLRSTQNVDGLADINHTIIFLKSQREHQRLLDRYSPLFDLTAQERIKATARRVGLNMPKLHQAGENEGEPKFSSPDTLPILQQAAHHLCDLQETVVFPTETVYGLGAVATITEASSKIFSAKGRPPDNPLIVHVSSVKMLKSLLPPDYLFSEAYQVLMKHFWPGALTLLFPRNSDVIPTIITAGQPSVAVRMPSHPVARALIAVSGMPLAAPSANTSGKPSPTRAEHVVKDLDGKVPLVIDGGSCGVGLESTVVDGLQGDGNIRILRPGGVTVEQIEAVLKQDFPTGRAPSVLVHKRDYQDEEMESAPTTPGMKYRHYSPSVPVTLLCTLSKPAPDQASQSIDTFLASISSPSKVGILAASDSKIWKKIKDIKGYHWHEFPLGPTSTPSLIAQRLFDGLLTLESENVDLILVEEIIEEHEGLAVMNRVRKAAGTTQWVWYE